LRDPERRHLAPSRRRRRRLHVLHDDAARSPTARGLHVRERFKSVPLAWPKLWKHHGAKAATDRSNEGARDMRNEPCARAYGGTIGIEWFFPKILETINDEPGVYDIADRLDLRPATGTSGKLVSGAVSRMLDQGHRAIDVPGRLQGRLWNGETGYPSRDYFGAVHRKMADVMSKMPGTLKSPGIRAAC
jgi:L-ribulokinase